MWIPLCVFKFDPFTVSKNTWDWKEPAHRILLTKIVRISPANGRLAGEVTAIGFRGAYATWIGYQVDAFPFVVLNNGGCLSEMGLVGPSGIGMPNYCPSWNGELTDPKAQATLAFTHKIPFTDHISIVIGNGTDQDIQVSGMHIYFRANPFQIKVEEGFLTPQWMVE